MCIPWLKKFFLQAGEPEVETPENGENEPVIIEQPEEDTGVTVSVPIIEEPIIVEPMKKPYEDKDFHILLDNGHASSTPGKRQQLGNGKYFYEWKFNREIVARIAAKLDELGIKYEILVPENDVDIALSARAARANSCCTKYGTDKCFFISVHSNAYGDGVTFTNAKGWSVWTTKGTTPSDKYATIFFEEAEKLLPDYGMTTRNDMQDGDPDYEENFTVIYKTWCPAVLTENMFFTNKEEVAWLMTDEGKDVIAEIHVNGIKRIIDGL